MGREAQYTSEKDVKRAVKKLLNQHKWFWWMPPANAFGKSGISDFHAIRAGVFMAIETKFDKNTPTEMQLGFLHSIQAEQGFAFIVNEKRLESLANFLQSFDNASKAASEKMTPETSDGAAMINAIADMQRELV